MFLGDVLIDAAPVDELLFVLPEEVGRALVVSMHVPEERVVDYLVLVHIRLLHLLAKRQPLRSELGGGKLVVGGLVF